MDVPRCPSHTDTQTEDVAVDQFSRGAVVDDTESVQLLRKRLRDVAHVVDDQMPPALALPFPQPPPMHAAECVPRNLFEKRRHDLHPVIDAGVVRHLSSPSSLQASARSPAENGRARLEKTATESVETPSIPGTEKAEVGLERITECQRGGVWGHGKRGGDAVFEKAANLMPASWKSSLVACRSQKYALTTHQIPGMFVALMDTEQSGVFLSL
jgi:hypothetical protein